jgi:hypothetical protein
MKATTVIAVLLLVFAVYANAKTIFVDDFEGETKGDWVFFDLEGKGIWEVVDFEGRGVFKVNAIDAWPVATVDGVASLADYDKIWATCSFMVEEGIESCTELGLLINPDNIPGNCYFATCEGGNEVGIDEATLAWHGRVPFKWGLGIWYKMKIMVSNEGTLYGKMWKENEDEPAEWTTQEALASHLDEDGVGLGVYALHIMMMSSLPQPRIHC